jgi:hypothetical protein
MQKATAVRAMDGGGKGAHKFEIDRSVFSTRVANSQAHPENRTVHRRANFAREAAIAAFGFHQYRSATTDNIDSSRPRPRTGMPQSEVLSGGRS